MTARQPRSHREPMSLPEGSESDHSQPHHRRGFAFGIHVQTALVSITVRLGSSRGECLKALIPSNPRARRALQLSDLYRGFEFLSLRHAVLAAEKLRPKVRKLLQNCGNFEGFSL